MSYWKKGTTLNEGQYIIESILLRATGSLSYKAKDQKTGELVTIKTITSASNNQEIEKDKIKELLKLSNCHHPNLVKMSSTIFEKDDQSYVVMEYIEGEDLASYLDHNGKYSNKDALSIIAKIGSALNLLHQNGFIHQDIKPQNIILKKNTLEPILHDFGLAIDVFSARKKKVNQNLLDAFIAPEIYQNPTQIGVYTDIYSLSATLYVLVTAQLPTAFNSRQYNPLIPPKQLNNNLTEELNQAILKGMEIDPSARPQNLKQWFKLLQTSSFTSQKNGIKNDETIVQKTDITNQNKATPLNIKTFEFESVSIETKKKFFGFISSLNINKIAKTGKYFEEKLNENTNVEMVYIPSGTFLIGSNNNELDRGKDENPQQKIKIKTFYMSKYPINQLQWRIVASMPQVNRTLNPNPSNFKGDNLPVEKISWYDAIEFCQRLTKQTNRQYRLPTEAEWEYACRAGTTTPFFFGEMITTDLANYDGRTGYGTKATGKYSKKTTPSDTFSPNNFGLYDLHGNVWEWCEDHYSTSYQSKPTDGSPYYSNMKNQPRAVRGGSWSLTGSYCRSAKRSSYAPDSNYNFVGFRIVCV